MEEQRSSEPTTPEEGSSEGLVETTKCPNCGREFVGNFCPECGQEADPSLSPFDVISGFFREIADLERGFWPTFKGLSVRPRTTLTEYLSGARREMAHPGRYLMAAIVLVYLVERLLVWSGVRDLYSFPSPQGEVGPAPTLGDLLGSWESIWLLRREALYSSQEFQIAAYLLLALLVSLMFFQILRERLGWGEALAMGAFISGQMILFVEIFVFFSDTLSLIQYFVIEEFINTQFGLSIGIVSFNNLPFTTYSVGFFLYITTLTLDRSEFQAQGDNWLSALQYEPPVNWITEEEPNYFFDTSIMVGLIFSVFQYVAIVGPAGLVIKNQIFSAGIAVFILIVLTPNLAIEIYQRAR